MQKTKKRETEFVGAMLPTVLVNKLRAAAKREHRSLSNMLVVFLERGDNHLCSTETDQGDAHVKSA